MSSPIKRGINLTPVVDEWGFYDPARAGLAAVMERLDAKGTATPSPSGSRIIVATRRESKEPSRNS